MNIKRTILVVTVFSLVTAVPLFSEEKMSARANNMSGKIQVSDDNGAKPWVQFRTQQGKNNRPAGGSFQYRPEGKSKETYVDVVYVKVDGEHGWLAGKCTRDGTDLVGRWLFLAAHDGGTPGRLVDHIWWEWLPNTADAESIAKRKVENLEKPANSKSIISGNIVVNFYDEVNFSRTHHTFSARLGKMIRRRK